MLTVLWYLVIAVLIGAVVFVVAVFVFGRSEQMAPLPPRTSPAQLPGDGEIVSGDVRALRFSLALRGYRMSDVDWSLDKLGDELDRLRGQNVRLREQVIGLGGDPTESLAPPEPLIDLIDDDAPGAVDRAADSDPITEPGVAATAGTRAPVPASPGPDLTKPVDEPGRHTAVDPGPESER
ncbi:DivIVA domain-containing protein [Nakamurella alba]|uniref:DivIVA domain-containing protein n=1 Tax=Nakamurella alba TaxID=2665158 RepID=UPI002AC35E19|nr:DivIVA domain-containing protein [Nakamurella alba]